MYVPFVFSFLSVGPFVELKARDRPFGRRSMKELMFLVVEPED
jgi:hypothetical protein